jgi:hypothetical protein
VLPLRKPPRSVLHHRESLRQDPVEVLPLLAEVRHLRELGLPGLRLAAQLVIRESLELLVQLVDTTDRRPHALDLALIFRAQYLL